MMATSPNSSSPFTTTSNCPPPTSAHSTHLTIPRLPASLASWVWKNRNTLKKSSPPLVTPHFPSPLLPPGSFAPFKLAAKRTYEDLRAEAITFNNWGIIADLHHYHEDNEKLTCLNHLCKQLTLKCDGLWETKALALARLESAHVSLHLSHARLLYVNSTSPPHSPCGMSSHEGHSNHRWQRNSVRGHGCPL